MSSSIGYSSQHLPISKSLKICNVDNNADFYFSFKTQTMAVCKAWLFLFLFKPGTRRNQSRHIWRTFNFVPSLCQAISIYPISELHSCHLEVCKWIQYLRNILAIYTIGPLSAIGGFSESKSHSWVWQRTVDIVLGMTQSKGPRSRKHISICLFYTQRPLADLPDNIPVKQQNTSGVLNLHFRAQSRQKEMILMFCDANSQDQMNDLWLNWN